MNLNEIKAIAVQRGIKCGKMSKSELVRAVQRQEGNTECYNTGQANSCGQDQCLWGDDCR